MFREVKGNVTWTNCPTFNRSREKSTSTKNTRFQSEMPLIQPRLLSCLLIRRHFTRLTCRRTSWPPSPSPPRLPKEEQEIFEQLQRQSAGAFSSPRETSPNLSESTRPDFPSLRARINQLPQSEPLSSSTSKVDQSPQSEESSGQYQIEAEGGGEELHPHIRRGAPPEFEGDTNPKTGEVGGPKNEPLRWGATGDWSYNGRVTDF